MYGEKVHQSVEFILTARPQGTHDKNKATTGRNKPEPHSRNALRLLYVHIQQTGFQLFVHSVHTATVLGLIPNFPGHSKCLF